MLSDWLNDNLGRFFFYISAEQESVSKENCSRAASPVILFL